MRLWPTLLGMLLFSGLACGGGSGSGGNGYDGGLDGGAAALDGAKAPTDLALSSLDQATAGIDQASGTDQVSAPADLGPVKLDGGISADARVSDTPTTPDVSPRLDLPGTADVFVKLDLPATSDLPVNRDLPSNRDLPANPDLPTTPDVFVALDMPGKADAPPAPDTYIEIDATAVVDTGPDTTPQTLSPDKLTYGPGEQLTATYTDGSTDTSAWIGIFPVGADDNAYRDWKYTGGATSGTMILHVPGTPGTYELRMFRDVGYTRIATSVPFVVTS